MHRAGVVVHQGGLRTGLMLNVTRMGKYLEGGNS